MHVFVCPYIPLMIDLLVYIWLDLYEVNRQKSVASYLIKCKACRLNLTKFCSTSCVHRLHLCSF